MIQNIGAFTQFSLLPSWSKSVSAMVPYFRPCFPVIQAVEIQTTLQDGHHLVNYNELHEKLQVFVSSDKEGFGRSRFG